MEVQNLADIHLDRPELPNASFQAAADLAALGEGAEVAFTDINNVYTAGDIELDPQNRLTKKYYTDSNNSRSDMYDYDAYMGLLLRQISGTKVPFNQGTYLSLRDVFFRIPYH